jgi:hypothetical protein
VAQLTEDDFARVNWLLTYLVDEWEDIPRLAEEWHMLDRIRRIHALVDWPVVESNLHTLEDYAAKGVLTPSRDARYMRPRALITKYHPVHRRLMAG